MIKAITITSQTGRGSIEMVYGDRRAYWLDDVDWEQLKGSHSTYSYYNQVGESIVSTAIGSRAISITGFVCEYSDSLQDRCDFLNTYFSPLEDYWLEFGDYKIAFRPDASITWSRTHRENNRKGRKFLIQGTASNPLFQSANATAETFFETQKAFVFPSAFGSAEPLIYGIMADNTETVISLTGGFETGVTVEISFSSAVTNPKVYNLTVGKYIVVDYSFEAGDVLEICTVPGDKHITLNSGGTITNLMRYRNVGTSWWMLQPGDNTLSLGCDDETELGGMNASIYYTTLFQEVE